MIPNIGKICFLVFMFCNHHATGFFRLTDEQFAMMPPLVNVDRFSHCVNKPGGVYCTAHADVVADRPNPIHFMMVNYTNAAERHYNYTQILHGLCMTDTCKNHLKGNSTPELISAAEGCLNETFKQKYELGVRIQKVNCYSHKEQKYKADYIDSIVFYVIAGILALNVIATVYDVIFQKVDEEGFLMSFSFRTNWRKLMAPPSKDPRISKLVGINGIRALTTIFVVLGHAPMPHFMAIENPQWLEAAFEDYGLQILFQGHVITQTFFIISGLLLTYNLQVLKETRKITWHMIPKGIFLRWLRLSPVNILIVTLSATWLRFTPSGPFWEENLGREVSDCRAYWPSIVFYYGNYVDESFCNMQNWSLSTDMHLHIIGLAIVILSPSARARNRALLAFLAVSLVLPAVEVYFRDLDATILVVAHAVRWYMTTMPTFRYLYKRTHTNMPCFVIGMYFGYLIYDLQRKPIAESTRKRLSSVYWLLFPAMLALTSLTFPLFLGDGPRAPLWLRIIFSMTQKPLFGLLVAFIITGLVVKVEETPIYKWILESYFWMPLSKISYSIFGTHVIIIRYLGGRKTVLSYVSFIHVIQEYMGVVMSCIVFGFFLYMLVEAPFNQVFKLILIARPKTSRKVENNNESGTYQNGKPAHANGNYIPNGIKFSVDTKLVKGE